MKILLLDIERSPVIATVWGLRDQNISIDQLIGDSEVLTWAAKWHGNGKMMDGSLLRDGKKRMLHRIHSLIDEADAVVTWNGTSFDLKVLQKEFLLVGLRPAAPIRSIDLLTVSYKQFKFTSHKMDHVAQMLGIGHKTRHRGHQMWLDCMNKDPKAFAEMLRYNRHDVELLAGIYEKFLPWVPNHPNLSTYKGVKCCPNCGSESFFQNGWAFTQHYKYARFCCRDCGKYFRATRTVSLARGDRVVGC